MYSWNANTAGVLGGTDASGTRKPLPEVSAVLRKAPLSVTVQTIPQTVTALCIPEGYVGGIAGNIYETEVYNSYVEGKVGSTSADYIIGGLVGRMQSGQVKNGDLREPSAPPLQPR